MSRLAVLFVVAAIGASSCKDRGASSLPTNNEGLQAPDAASQRNEELHEFFEEVFARDLARSPIRQTYLGIKTDYGKWDDLSDARARENHQFNKDDLARLQSQFGDLALSDSDRLSYRLFEYEKQMAIAAFKWRFHNYPANQMHGQQSQVPAILINFHLINSAEDAEAYLSRLAGVPALFSQLKAALTVREKLGILPPAFVFPHLLSDCANVIAGAPFEDSKNDSPLLADFRDKVMTLETLSAEEKDKLIARAEEALRKEVGPAYRDLIAFFEGQQSKAKADDGAWKFPDGENFYAHALERTTTTRMSADEIHQLGLDEVARIHEEMRAIMSKVGFSGSLQEFFEFMRTDKQFYFEDSEEGRAAYLARAEEILAAMNERLPEVFVTLPDAQMKVKRVEAYREKSAGKAFYSSPSIDGSRPGIYYANLYQMSDMPSYQMEALAYHEGIPGHHMQNAIAQELEGLPKFRRFGGYAAHGEGWGLYSEYLPKEMGFYSDPYSDFGRLAMELWRACRLVVDTGIHKKKWTRQQAIDYLRENTPNAEGDVVKAVERYIVVPSQATAYKVGMRKILELRERARKEIGEADFRLKDFHELVLGSGPMPLQILEDRVDAWISKKKPVLIEGNTN